MRVLVANKFWYRRGGLERVMFDEIAWLENAGHTVGHFSTRHPRNIDSPYSEYFAEYIELGAGGSRSKADSAKAAVRMFRNREAARRFAEAIDAFAPDVIHAHGIHRQLSPSILGVARSRGIPVVQTLHDAHHVCPNDIIPGGDGASCDPHRCTAFDYTPCIRNRCVRGSLAASLLSAAETSFQRATRAYERGIARFISPSRFLADLMVEGGWRIPTDIIPNAVALPDLEPSAPGDYFLFAGRLVAGKGVEVLLRAAEKSGARVLVAGDGPKAETFKHDAPGSVEFLGHLDAGEVERLAAGARAVVVPSVWFENAPMSVLEAMAVGTAVVASRIGGIPELVEDGIEGLLVEPGDVDALAAAMGQLAGDASKAAAMGRAGRERVARDFTPEVHTGLLVETYERAIGGHA